MAAAQHNWRVIYGGLEQRPAVDNELRELISELDRPLMAGFMAAGYGALGRYLFLAAMKREPADRPRDMTMR